MTNLSAPANKEKRREQGVFGKICLTKSGERGCFFIIWKGKGGLRGPFFVAPNCLQIICVYTTYD